MVTVRLSTVYLQETIKDCEQKKTNDTSVSSSKMHDESKKIEREI